MGRIETSLQSGVALIQLDNPPVNAITAEMVGRLDRTFAELADDRAVRAVVLTGQGTRAFCAGIDLNQPGAGSEPTPTEQLDEGGAWRSAQHAVLHCPVPVIAAVEGAAVGAGFGLVGVCDVIVAAENARFGLTEINVGLLGGASKALRMVGPYKARMMLFSGELVGAEEMYRRGVLEDLVPAGRALERAMEIAGVFAAKSPIGLRLAKESMLRIEDLGLEDGYRLEQDYTRRLRTYADSREAFRAYREKREPRWTWS